MKNILYVLLVLVYGCTPKVAKQPSTSLKTLPLTVELNFSDSSTIQFIISNSNNGPFYIHQHPKLNIERLTDGKWQQLRILPCPCGAPCAKPSEFIEFPAEAEYTYKWNKMESWCGEMGNAPVPETISQFAGSGTYRIIIYYSYDKKNVLEFFKEFTLE
jgi:hypothetical protein